MRTCILKTKISFTLNEAEKPLAIDQWREHARCFNPRLNKTAAFLSEIFL